MSVKERNRLAAQQCRARKRQWTDELKQRHERLQAENDTLAQEERLLMEQLGRLRGLLATYSACSRPSVVKQ
jgi:chaperonin cofactor prefoldin